jgi:glycosyltransferase involved in cell wall biosynthesis
MVVVVDEGPKRGVRGLFELADQREGELRVFRLSYRRSAGTVAYLPGVLEIARRLNREQTPVDLLHAHVHRMGWAAVLAGALLRRPVVITEHSTEWPDGTITRGALRRARFAFRRAALVCPVSKRLQRAIEGYGIQARFRVVPNTVDTQIFHPPAARRATSATNRLVNVGLHIERKGLDVLLCAIARLAEARPKLRLELVGEGPATPGLKRLAAKLGVEKRVRFSGATTPEQTAEALRGSDAFVLSSLSETGPLVVLEALCCGLPVVSTRVGSAPEVIGNDGALAEPGDVEGLAEAICEVLDASESFDHEAIARRAAGRASFESVGRVWDEIYGSL